MMRRIDLLPESYVQRQRQRRLIGGVVGAGIVLLLLLVAWWVFLGMQISDANNELADVQARNAQLQAQIDELQRFADLDAELRAKREALVTVMAGDVSWPTLLTEIAMVIPGEVWLENIVASAGETVGATPVGTETATVRIARDAAFGRIQFTGRAVSMPGVARWLIRLATVNEFQAIWLNSAVAEDIPAGVGVVTFDSTLEFDDGAASERFQQFGEDL
jgi:Tfp pilus assembly protein PilN